jgi:DNA-binding transcriptional MerR regulator
MKSHPSRAEKLPLATAEIDKTSNPRDWSIWSIGEFAAMSGVTIRALRFYDRKGLLHPAKVSESGYRLYSTNELLRLQHIMTLKTLGCSLETIARVLEHNKSVRSSAVELLAQQRSMVEKELNRLQIIAQAIAAAEEFVRREGEISWSSIHTILKVITMQPSKESQQWTEQFFSSEQKTTLAKHTPAYMLDKEKGAKVAADWASLIAEVNTALEHKLKPESPEAKVLADRWMALVDLFTQGNPAMLQSLNTMYSNVENSTNPAPEDFQDFYGGMKPAMEFIQSVMRIKQGTERKLDVK